MYASGYTPIRGVDAGSLHAYVKQVNSDQGGPWFEQRTTTGISVVRITATAAARHASREPRSAKQNYNNDNTNTKSTSQHHKETQLAILQLNNRQTNDETKAIAT